MPAIEAAPTPSGAHSEAVRKGGFSVGGDAMEWFYRAVCRVFRHDWSAAWCLRCRVYRWDK